MAIYEFDVLVHNKSVIHYPHQGRTYIEGRAGSEFTLVVRNNTASAVLAVISVDGLSVMDGKLASKNDGGYVVDPFSSLTIPGWRLDDNDVAHFVFSGNGKSYAVKSGKGDNVGVIGCAIFEQQCAQTITICGCPWWSPYPVAPYWYTTNTDSTGRAPNWEGNSTRDLTPEITYSASYNTVHANEAPTVTNSCYYAHCESAPSETSCTVTCSDVVPNAEPQNLGIGFGKRTKCAVTSVEFKREEAPSEVFTIYYDDRSGLKARGIDLERKIRIAAPFPADKAQGCKPPVGWKG
jgi:hypothetical protein